MKYEVILKGNPTEIPEESRYSESNVQIQDQSEWIRAEMTFH